MIRVHSGSWEGLLGQLAEVRGPVRLPLHLGTADWQTETLIISHGDRIRVELPLMISWGAEGGAIG